MFSDLAEGRYYKASGKVPFMSLVFMGAIGVVSGIILGAIYGVVSAYNPVIFVNIIATLILGLAVGFCISLGAQWGKARAPWLGALFGLGAGAVALYAQWIVWARVYEEVWLYHPLDMADYLLFVSEEGVWGMFGVQPTGLFLMCFWLAEAAIAVGSASWMSYTMMASMPFCETCNVWVVSDAEELELGEVADKAYFVSRLEEGDFSALTDIGARTSADYSKLKLEVCAGCHELGFLSVESVSLGDGETDDVTSDIVKNLVLHPYEIERVLEYVEPS